MQGLVSSIYSALGIQVSVTDGDVAGLISVLFLITVSLINLFLKVSDTPAKTPAARKVTPTLDQKEEVALPAPEKEATPELASTKDLDTGKKVEEAVEQKVSWTDRLKKGLSKSRKEVWGKLGSIMSGSSLDEDQVEEIEELLYSADIGPELVSELIEELQKNVGKDNFKEDALKEFLFGFLKNKMVDFQNEVDSDLYKFDESKKGKTKVIMIVGVNGAGKTTTIGKLATKLTRQGAKVVVGACDTFRAAAVDQLEVWCERAGAEMIRAKEGADPSGVAYDAVAKANSMNADYCLIDTAGRLHTKENLMDELSKNRKVISKVDDTAPHQVLLVIDSITGQNALRQAEEFNKALDVTGLVFTKCDGSSKAGNAISIVRKLEIPITYIGVGEGVDDIDIFNLDDYLHALLDY